MRFTKATELFGEGKEKQRIFRIKKDYSSFLGAIHLSIRFLLEDVVSGPEMRYRLIRSPGLITKALRILVANRHTSTDPLASLAGRGKHMARFVHTCPFRVIDSQLLDKDKRFSSDKPFGDHCSDFAQHLLLGRARASSVEQMGYGSP